MRKKVWLGAVLFTLLPLMAYAQDQKEALLQELYVKSGMEKQFAQIPYIIQTGLDRAAPSDPRFHKLSKDFLNTMKGLVQGAYAPETLKKTIIKALGENLSGPDIKPVLAWLGTPSGKTCTRLEEESSLPGAVLKMEQFASLMQKLPPSPDRLDLLKKLDAAVKATDSSVQIVISTQLALAMAANATLPREEQKPPDQLAREVEKIRPQIESAVKAQVRISLLYTYRDLSEAQIQEYYDFLTSPAGSKYTSVSLEVLRQALFEGSQRWGKAIGEAMKIERRGQ